MPTPAEDVMTWIMTEATTAERDKLARYGIPDDRAVGIAVGTLKKKAKVIGTDHALAQDLWRTGVYEARILATFIDEPARVTSTQMDRWASSFDSWSICDSACFALFDRTPHAWGKVTAWSKAKAEFKKRGAFALLWSLSVHDKHADDAAFVRGLALMKRCADDERLYVKKGIDMALRAVGKRNRALHAAALDTARALELQKAPSAQWIGAHARRELESAKIEAMLSRRG